MRLDFNYSEANYESLRAKHPNWLIYGSETSSATRTRGSYYHPEREWVGSNQEDRHYEQSDYGNDRLVGVGQRPPLGPLTAIMPAMQGNLSGQVPTISVSQPHGTTKMTHL